MKVVAWCLDRPVATAVVWIGLLLLGLVSLGQLPIDLLPSIDSPRLSIDVEYPGAGPVEVEHLITEPLEVALSSVPNVREIQSVSHQGRACLTATFVWGADMDFALMHIREAIERVRPHLPRDLHRPPTVLSHDPSAQPIMLIAFTGEDSVELEVYATDYLKPRFEQLAGVARAQILGGQERLARVTLNPGKARLFGLTPLGVAETVAAFHAADWAGIVDNCWRRQMIRLEGRPVDLESFRRIPVGRAGAPPLPLSEVADVSWGWRERTGRVRLDGQTGIAIEIFKAGGSSTVSVTRSVKELLAELGDGRSAFPGRLIRAEAEYIQASLDALSGAVLVGGGLVVLIIWLALGSARQALTIGVVIPLAIVISFNIMFLGGISLNVMSLGGLMLGIGLFVDHAIVILESISQHREAGHADRVSTLRGTRLVAGPILAATLTTIAVFLPVVFLRGITAELFREEALTVTIALLVSLAIALTFLPVMATPRLPRTRIGAQPMRPGGPWKSSFDRLYGWLERVCLFPWWIGRRLMRWPWRLRQQRLTAIVRPVEAGRWAHQVFGRVLTKSACIYHHLLDRALVRPIPALGLLVVALLVAAPWAWRLQTELLPEPVTREFVATAVFPPETPFSAIEAFADRLDRHMARLPMIRQRYLETGRVRLETRDDGEDGQSLLRLMGRIDRPASLKRLIEEWHRWWSDWPEIQCDIRAEKASFARMLSFEPGRMEIRLSGAELAELRRLGIELQAELEKMGWDTPFQLSPTATREAMRVVYRRSALERYGLSPAELNRHIGAMLRGASAGWVQQGDKQVEIVVGLPGTGRFDPDDLVRLAWVDPKRLVPLGELLDLAPSQEDAQIRRIGGRRQLALCAAWPKGGRSEWPQRIDSFLSGWSLPAGYAVSRAGEAEETRVALSSLGWAMALALVLVYMILAGQFESLRLPLLISAVVPMGLSGSVVLLGLVGGSLNIISVIGMIVMIGVVVNDAIVKTDYIHRLVRSGQSPEAAVREAARVKFRPIVMTTLTTVLGLMPVALGFGEGSELQRPLAVAFIGGMITGTALTLVFTPVIYVLLFRRICPS